MRIHSLVLALLPLLLLACGGEEYTSTGGGGGGGGVQPGTGGAYTGILLNAQRPPSETPFKGTLDKWTVADAAGNVLFSSDQVPTTGKGALWEWRHAEATGLSANMWLGKNPYEVRVVRDQFSEDQKTGTFTVSDATAAELRNMANLTSLLSKANIVVLVGKMGQ